MSWQVDKLRRCGGQSCIQVFHYVGHYTWAEVDVVGYLQIPTFFLLSGFCLSLGTFWNFLFPVIPFTMFTGYGSPSKSWQASEFYLARVSKLYPIYLLANLLGLAGWQPSPVTMLR